jgi:hypothetical protein
MPISKRILRGARGLAMTLVTLASLAALSRDSALAVSQTSDVGSDYAVVVVSGYAQSDTTGPATKNSYKLNAIVEQASGGLLTGGTLGVPSGGTVTGSQDLYSADKGNGEYEYQSDKFTNLSGLRAAYASGEYTLSISGEHGNYSATLDLASKNLVSGTFPGQVPDVANTTWSDGNLMLNPAVSNTLSWNAFTDASTESADKIYLEIQNENTSVDSLLTILPGTMTSEILAANFLAPDTTYQVSLAFIAATAAVDTADISSSSGLAGYADSTNFTLETIPEPSNAALGLLGLTAIAGCLCRRKAQPGQ